MAFNQLIENLSFESSGKVAIYIRVSTAHQIDKDSLPVQRKELINYSKYVLGIEDYVLFEDAGFSGKNTNRPQYQEMMGRIRTGEFTHLLVYKIDRISRNIVDFALMYTELAKHDVVFVSKNEQFQTDNAIGKAMLRIILIFAELERDITSERVSDVMTSRAASGKWNGGRVPFGYTCENLKRTNGKEKEDVSDEESIFVINVEEAVVVKRIFDEYQMKQSIGAVAKSLNADGLRTRQGKSWGQANIAKILHNVWYIGYYRYNMTSQGDGWKMKSEKEWIVIKDHHLPLIDKEQFELVQKMMKSNHKSRAVNSPKKNTKHINIFQGLLYCNACGKMYVANYGQLRVSGMKGSRYICPTKKIDHNKECMNTSDVVVGPFIVNYISNMLQAQKQANNIRSIRGLEKILLSGRHFNNIAGIKKEGLADTYSVLCQTNRKSYFRPDNIEKISDHLKLHQLREETKQLERASEKLRKIYLYEDNIMNEREYLLERNKIAARMEQISEEMEKVLNDSEFEQSITDEELVSIASQYFLEQKLHGNEDIDFESLLLYTDAGLLQLFIRSIIEAILMDKGNVHSIIFKNGIRHEFEYKKG